MPKSKLDIESGETSFHLSLLLLNSIDYRNIPFIWKTKFEIDACFVSMVFTNAPWNNLLYS